VQAVGYCRVSGKNQIEKLGFDRQEEKIKRYCKKNKITLAQIYKEQVSGAKGENDRPEFTSMINNVLSNGARTIIVESLDRLAREYRIQEQILFYIASKGIDLISADSGENITQEIRKDPVKKALIQMQGIFSELEKSRLVKKLKDAREKKKAATGKCEGAPCFGDLEQEKEILKYIINARLDNEEKYFIGNRKRPPKSFRDIAEDLNTKCSSGENYQPKRAEKWTTFTVFHVFKRAGELGLYEKITTPKIRKRGIIKAA
jgi:DNA invertase Pin-like site-specific DNA recombinase